MFEHRVYVITYDNVSAINSMEYPSVSYKAVILCRIVLLIIRSGHENATRERVSTCLSVHIANIYTIQETSDYILSCVHIKPIQLKRMLYVLKEDTEY